MWDVKINVRKLHGIESQSPIFEPPLRCYVHLANQVRATNEACLTGDSCEWNNEVRINGVRPGSTCALIVMRCKDVTCDLNGNEIPHRMAFTSFPLPHEIPAKRIGCTLPVVLRTTVGDASGVITVSVAVRASPPGTEVRGLAHNKSDKPNEVFELHKKWLSERQNNANPIITTRKNNLPSSDSSDNAWDPLSPHPPVPHSMPTFPQRIDSWRNSVLEETLQPPKTRITLTWTHRELAALVSHLEHLPMGHVSVQKFVEIAQQADRRATSEKILLLYNSFKSYSQDQIVQDLFSQIDKGQRLERLWWYAVGKYAHPNTQPPRLTETEMKRLLEDLPLGKSTPDVAQTIAAMKDFLFKDRTKELVLGKAQFFCILLDARFGYLCQQLENAPRDTTVPVCVVPVCRQPLPFFPLAFAADCCLENREPESSGCAIM
eukprot:TRINITY_DN6265_c0_g1_i1.p1 TRINITY_DN6265_c0_g1~~TRINITY_DN6265_c0_g1_i1.p1  ORF type:complete len:433 (+),score=47.24 TRINITY_DN6265_c0_g1_i1:58-1356(+)